MRDGWGSELRRTVVVVVAVNMALIHCYCNYNNYHAAPSSVSPLLIFRFPDPQIVPVHVGDYCLFVGNRGLGLPLVKSLLVSSPLRDHFHPNKQTRLQQQNRKSRLVCGCLLACPPPVFTNTTSQPWELSPPCPWLTGLAWLGWGPLGSPRWKGKDDPVVFGEPLELCVKC